LGAVVVDNDFGIVTGERGNSCLSLDTPGDSNVVADISSGCVRIELAIDIVAAEIVALFCPDV